MSIYLTNKMKKYLETQTIKIHSRKKKEKENLVPYTKKIQLVDNLTKKTLGLNGFIGELQQTFKE